MKYTFLLLISLNVYANKVPLSEAIRYIEANGTPVAGLYECKDKPDEQCLDFSHIESWETAELADEWVNDLDKPIRNKTQVEKCKKPKDETPQCQEELLALVCEEEGAEKFASEDLEEVYCSKITGYEQIKSGNKILVNNEEKVKAKKEKEKKEKEAREADALAKKAMECGQSVQRLLLVRNASKRLATAQVKQLVKTYSDVKDLLDTGSLNSAREEILAITPDGTIVTEEDKQALIAHLDGCKI